MLDKSSSMLNPIGSDTKWDIATIAIDQLTNQYGESIDLGLMIFPDPNQCSPGNVVVDVAPNTGAAILAALGDPPPSGGNYTPMAQSLEAAGTYTPLLDVSRDNYVILITDGWQWCDPYDPATRFLPVQAVTNLTDLGIATYVVGFGDGVDVLTLNRAAVAGGTSPAGCDETSSDPANPDNCYFQADNLTELSSALDQIALQLTQEVCDGEDNDCNGQIDDGLSRSCSSACGTGTEFCNLGTWMGCTAPEPETEECDGDDNDCDGIVDEGCACIEGESRPCGIEEGACELGTQQCQSGLWSDCLGGQEPVAEECDGVDNNCNGEIDEGLHRQCQTLCGFGEEICVDGQWDHCSSPLPTGEICDAIDNDCDGEVDEGSLCGLNAVCINGSCVEVENPVDAGVPGPDGGGSTTTPTSPDGCGCAATGDPGATPGLLLILALLWIRRRR